MSLLQKIMIVATRGVRLSLRLESISSKGMCESDFNIWESVEIGVIRYVKYEICDFGRVGEGIIFLEA